MLIVEREGTPILGKRERAEQLVSWSETHKPGTRWVKELPVGLVLAFVSNGSEPKLYVHWNHQRFLSYIKTLDQFERLSICAYGFSINHSEGETSVKLLGAGGTGACLWDTKNNSFSRQHSKEDALDNVSWLVGLIKFEEDGPHFYEQTTSQQELEEASAVAVIHTRHSKTVEPGTLLSPPRDRASAAQGNIRALLR